MRSGKDDGFTLTEAVIALLVISLSLAGVLQLARLSARDQKRTVEQVVEAKAHRDGLQRLQMELNAVEPLYADQFSATPQGLGCLPVAPKPCAIKPPKGYQFRYVVAGQETPQWPLSATSDETVGYATKERLNALIVLDKEGRVAGAIELKVDHPPDCQFDMISRACRRPQGGEAQASQSAGEGP
ncbi:type II secretion system protein [Asticcacaulis sp. W401b]|uniref:type IV pilus modification PilV family protein n=1 Tax=Asticcacaulis sp. W401b TaxID=3388666 RepID=UPI0039706D2F